MMTFSHLYFEDITLLPNFVTRNNKNSFYKSGTIFTVNKNNGGFVMNIRKLWFANNRIYIQTTEGEELYQFLYFYPRLLHATPEQLADCELWDDGIHWEALDEDVSFESFRYPETKEPATGLQAAFLTNPELNVSAVARRIGIRQSLLASYIKGTKKPSNERKTQILNAIHSIGQSLMNVNF